jgi:DNA-binding IclR family transcriptional regulator
MEEAPTNHVKTTQKSLSIIELLREEGPMRLTEIANSVELPKSVVYNHLDTLKSCGYVRGVDGRYRLGLKFLEIGGQIRKRRSLYQAAQREVQELADSTDELANLMIEESGIGVYLFRAIGSNAVRLDTYAGMRTPINTTALGKATLAYLPEERVDEIIETHGLPSVTENTVSNETDLIEELEEIRDRGYALDDGERIEGLRCVAAPVTDNGGVAIGAISVSGPKNRLRENRFNEELPDKVTGVANVIELNMKFD